MEIDEEILKNTTECNKNFHCLSTGNHIYCKVETCINNKVHFVKCMSEESCPYKMNFGR